MSIFSDEFMIVPVADGGYVLKRQGLMQWRDGISASPKDMYAFTTLQDLLDFLSDQATEFRALPTQEQVNKLK